MILVVLESVAARWTSLGNARYETTPTLTAEAGHALVYDNFYAHIGRSSNSLAAILLSTYPKLDFQDVTEEYPDLGGTSLASHVPRPRLSHVVRDVERPAAGPAGTASSRRAASSACATITT